MPVRRLSWVFSSLRDAFMFCPAGCGRDARAAHRAPPSDPPARATEQARAAGGPSPSPSLRSGSAFPPAALAARDPHAPAPSAFARWAVFAHPPPRLVEALLVTFGLARIVDPQQDLRLVGGGVVDPPVPRVAIGSCARGPRTGEPRRGVDGSDRASCAREENSEGFRRGSPCPVAGAGACGLGRGGARARIRPLAGPARRKASTQWKKDQ